MIRALATLGLVVGVGRASANPSPHIYVNRCTGGCAVTAGPVDNAQTQTSSMITSDGTIGEFADDGGEIGASADAEWAQVLGCLKDVYSPYAVTVTDQLSAIPAGASYTEVIAAGLPADVGLADVLAIAPKTTMCGAMDDAIAFAFANADAPQDRVAKICADAAQQTGLVFGLDASMDACDVMSSRTVCGGERFFRNETTACEYATCRCGSTQNSHEELLGLFGAGASTVPVTASITNPAPDATVADGSAIHANAGSRRAVEHVELWLNGYKWATVPGAAFDLEGQPDPSDYALAIPDGVPDSIIDVVVKAYDDIGGEGDSTITVTKGAPGGCVTAATCANGQACAQGRCFWAPAVGVLGDACTYDQFCTSGDCASTSVGQLCTQSCIVGAMDACPSGFDCTGSICLPVSHGGGCDVGSADAPIVFGLVGFALVIRRRRR